MLNNWMGPSFPFSINTLLQTVLLFIAIIPITLPCHHLWKGDELLQEVTQFPDLAQGLALWGASMTFDPQEVLIPVLTLQGDIDGVHRITQFAQSFL